MKRRTFNPNVNGLFVWPPTWATEAEAALEQLGRTLGVRYPEAQLIRGGSAVYALHDEVIVGVAWIEPELVEGRVVGVERFVGALAGRS